MENLEANMLKYGTMMEKTRVFVGGLGGSVTEDDLRKTFSSLGEVVSVDVVRTKGRSFAYIDFLPSSDKSLAKLFSTYNGCIWKGGKLKLEKAKEHYLHRLRREWQEDARSVSDASNSDADASNITSSKSLDLLTRPRGPISSDKMQIQIFFPKLKKVKSLAPSGTGKHKYSFQRFQGSTTPVNFCDCEGHSGASIITKDKHFLNPETAGGGIDEKEFNMMLSVMNKFLEKESSFSKTSSKAEFVNEVGDPANSNHDFSACEDKADHLADEDNMVMNIVAGKGDSDEYSLISNMVAGVKAKNMANKDRKTKDINQTRKKILPGSKKRKSTFSEESDGNEKVSSVPATTKQSQVHLHMQDGKTGQDVGTRRLAGKSAWKELVGKKGGNAPFSISDIVPTVPCKENEEPEKASSITDIQNPNVEATDMETEAGKVMDMEAVNLETNATESQTSQPKGVEKPSVAPDEEPKEVSKKVARGAAWLHKSSWTQLVAATINTPFTLSQVLPNLPSEKQEVQNATDMESVSSESKQHHADGSESKTLLNENQSGRVIEERSSKERHATGKKGQVSIVAPPPVKKNLPVRKPVSLRDLESEETCAFMRNDDSMKEWKKAKAAMISGCSVKKREKLKSGVP